MGWKFSLAVSPMPVYYWAKLIGLAPFTVKNNRSHPPTMLEKLYPITVGAAYLSFIITITTPMVMKALSEKMGTEPLSFLNASEHYTDFIKTFFTMIIFVLSYEKIISLMNKLCATSNELKTIGIEEDHEKLLKNILTITATANAAVITFCFAVYMINPVWEIPMTLGYSIGRMFNVNILLIYAQVLKCIKQRFRLLNIGLLNVLEPAYRVRSHHDSQTREADQTPSDLQNIRKIEALHLELCDLVDSTIQLFTTAILLTVYDLFATITLSGFFVYHAVVDSSYSCPTEASKKLPMRGLAFVVLKIIVYALEALIIGETSSTVCEEGNTTGAVLFKVWYKFKPLELKDEFAMFSVQMMQKPVVTSVWGLLDVGYSLVYKIICAAAAYLVILIQMDVPKPCP